MLLSASQCLESQVVHVALSHTQVTADHNSQLISPDQTPEQQVLDPTGPGLQLYCTEAWFDLDLKDLALNFLTPSPRNPVPRGL